MITFSDNLFLAAKVADRAEAIGFDVSRTGLIMDITAADGENGNLPIDFHAWLNASDGQFMHDVGGIYKHLNRETGFLDGCFLPRFAFNPTEVG